MSNIKFSNGLILNGFNLYQHADNIIYPTSFDLEEIQKSTKNSTLYYYSTDPFVKNNDIYVYHQNTALATDNVAVYKKTDKDDRWTHLVSIEGAVNTIKDYNVNSNENYKYRIFFNPDNSTESTYIDMENYIHYRQPYWTLCDLIYDIDKGIYIPSDTTLIFKHNMQAGSVSDNLQIVKYDTLSRYGKIIHSKQNYDTGNVSCLLGDMQVVQHIENGNKIEINDCNQISDLLEKHNNYYRKKNLTNSSNNYEYEVYSDDLSDGYIYLPNVTNDYQYYKCIGYDAYSQYNLLTEEPSNWQTQYQNYYIKDEMEQYLQIQTPPSISFKENNYYELICEAYKNQRGFKINDISQQEDGVHYTLDSRYGIETNDICYITFKDPKDEEQKTLEAGQVVNINDYDYTKSIIILDRTNNDILNIDVDAQDVYLFIEDKPLIGSHNIGYKLLNTKPNNWEQGYTEYYIDNVDRLYNLKDFILDARDIDQYTIMDGIIKVEGDFWVGDNISISINNLTLDQEYSISLTNGKGEHLPFYLMFFYGNGMTSLGDQEYIPDGQYNFKANEESACVHIMYRFPNNYDFINDLDRPLSATVDLRFDFKPSSLNDTVSYQIQDSQSPCCQLLIPFFTDMFYELEQYKISLWNALPYSYMYLSTKEGIEQWRKIMHSGNYKLLKSPNGQSWIVDINNATNFEVNYNSTSYPATINFDWQEVAPIKQNTIVKWSD